ncbi:MAG: ABC transporter ATP-binding protein [Hydrogenophaga sp.]|jgi:simple sugar transport system ATP-binding protein|nr:ABC transporter ATP-binding protein [Hydrogenophaga sp.]
MTDVPLLEARGITVRYGDFVANDGIDLKLQGGQIHAVLGENGAGKSTLMNVLCGLQWPAVGELLVRGREVRFSNPADATASGIGMVHQHGMLVERMTVVENVVLGTGKGLSGMDLVAQAERLSAISRRAGLGVEPFARVQDLSPGERQRVEILKLLHRDAHIIILDEPTSVLAPLEIQPFLKLLRTLADEGRAVVLITHKLDEVVQVAEMITVLRGGRVVASRPLDDASTRELAELMMGTASAPMAQRSVMPLSDVIGIELQGVSVKPSQGSTGLREASLAVHAGEIVGVAGVDGNGQHALAEAIAGLLPVESGQLHIRGVNVKAHNAVRRRALGFAYLPEDRHHTGLVLDLSVAENIALHDFKKPPLASRLGLLRRKHMQLRAEEAVRKHDIRLRSVEQQVRWLSGGNQQKVILARELRSSPKAMVVSQPCKGLDVAATRAVHEALFAEREKGAAILYISTELDHLMATCDRVVVMLRGQIVGNVVMGRAASSEQLAQIGRLMAGSERPLDVH